METQPVLGVQGVGKFDHKHGILILHLFSEILYKKGQEKYDLCV